MALEVSKTPQESPKGPPKKAPRSHTRLLQMGVSRMLVFSPFDSPTLQDGSRGSQDRSKTTQEAPKR
eukprot:814595-Pyramimonas_sp.AAC.1